MEFIDVARNIDAFAADAVAEDKRGGQGFGGSIDTIQEEPVRTAVARHAVRLEAGDPEAVRASARQSKSPRHLAQQAGVGAHALSRAKDRSGLTEDLDLD